MPDRRWGIEYESVPNPGTLVPNGFSHWPAAKLDEFRLNGDKAEAKGKPPSIIYLANASMEQHNRCFGAVYG